LRKTRLHIWEKPRLYLPALERFHQMVEHIHQDKKMGWDATEAGPGIWDSVVEENSFNT
jgi:hypothetical protein